MKSLFISIAALLFSVFLFAQQSDHNVYVVQFKDKGVNMDAGINPSSYLSEKSVERRLKHQIAFDESDLPVNELYIKTITDQGGKILTRSRWLNSVVIEADVEILLWVEKLPFVGSVNVLNTQSASNKAGIKPYFANEEIISSNQHISKKVSTDVYDYGGAYNQISQMNGQFLHNNGYSGQGMTIAVIDAGFNSVDVMTCFDSLRANDQIKGTRDFAVPGNNVYATTMHSHGTSVLSCMGAYTSGIMVGTAPKADYWLLRSEVGESESLIEEYYWVSAAEFADSIGADLINSSLGYTEFDDPSTNHTYADMDGNTTVVTIGADKAASKGILVVNSAGNSGGGGWWYIGAPADGDSVFSIGAVDAGGFRAGYSSVGPTYDGRIKPTVSAQGSGSALFFPGGFGYGSGTSFSSPITCGITACFWQAFPELNNMEIIDFVKASGSQANQPDSLLGWGIPNFQSAFTDLTVLNEKAESELIAYPNPVSDILTIGFPSPLLGQYKVEIVDLQGRIVYTKVANEGSVQSLVISNIDFLPSGIYLIKVTNSKFNFTGRIVKE